MYTHTIAERDKLYTKLAAVVIPALRQTLQEAAEDLVYELEGFHPDMAYDAHVQAAADEMTALLCGYFAGLSYRRAQDLFDAVDSGDIYAWLHQHDLAARVK